MRTIRVSEERENKLMEGRVKYLHKEGDWI